MDPFDGGGGAFLVTFDNEDGITIGQTDFLDYRPDTALIGSILTTQPEGDSTTVATSATITFVTLDSSGQVVNSQLVALIWVVR